MRINVPWNTIHFSYLVPRTTEEEGLGKGAKGIFFAEVLTFKEKLA